MKRGSNKIEAEVEVKIIVYRQCMFVSEFVAGTVGDRMAHTYQM